jgi:polysaccharide deacetylase 2 family uncharacterized protein YibQ
MGQPQVNDICRWHWVLLLSLYLLAFDVASAAPTPNQPAQLAIIIDDLGYSLKLGKQTLDLPIPLTVAVLPFTPNGRELANHAALRHKEVMLHLPMSNHHHFPLGKGGLISGMSKAEFLAVLRRNLADMPHVQGVNNHMGSQLTEESRPMAWLMEELQYQQLYFVDSRTTAKTQALQQAEQIGLPSRRRDVFLDDIQDETIIQQQLVLALQKARQQGSAIAIGHPYPETLRVLAKLPELLLLHPVELVRVSQLMPNAGLPVKTRKQVATYCMAPPISLWPEVWLPVNPFDYNPILWEN